MRHRARTVSAGEGLACEATSSLRVGTHVQFLYIQWFTKSVLVHLSLPKPCVSSDIYCYKYTRIFHEVACAKYSSTQLVRNLVTVDKLLLQYT
jgi:hypothetical protein